MKRPFHPTRFLALLLPLVMGALAASAGAVESSRGTIDLNTGWKFIRQDVADMEKPGFDDSAWQAVDVPHTWNALDGQDGGDNFYKGVGCYRRHVSVDATGKMFYLHFDAASANAQVFVNGQLVGSHRGMFGAFAFDVTKQLHIPGDNVIAVRLSNAKDGTMPPLSADFTFFGGIYRGVRLLSLDPLSIDPLDEASGGVYVKQSAVDAEHAEIEITTKLRNASAEAKTATVNCELIDAAGTVVHVVKTDTPLPASGLADSVQKVSLDHPHLWNGRKDAYLYQMRVTVSDGTRVVDQSVEPVGLRFFKVDPNLGFILNGQPYNLHGVNRHQDRLDKGWAIGPAEHEEDYRLIEEMGCTAIRLAHYEHAQEFYSLCDRGGMVVWAEVCVVNGVSPSQAFIDNSQQQLRELIKQNFNHPSICFLEPVQRTSAGKWNQR